MQYLHVPPAPRTMSLELIGWVFALSGLLTSKHTPPCFVQAIMCLAEAKKRITGIENPRFVLLNKLKRFWDATLLVDRIFTGIEPESEKSDMLSSCMELMGSMMTSG